MVSNDRSFSGKGVVFFTAAVKQKEVGTTTITGPDVHVNLHTVAQEIRGICTFLKPDL